MAVDKRTIFLREALKLNKPIHIRTRPGMGTVLILQELAKEMKRNVVPVNFVKGYHSATYFNSILLIDDWHTLSAAHASSALAYAVDKCIFGEDNIMVIIEHDADKAVTASIPSAILNKCILIDWLEVTTNA